MTRIFLLALAFALAGCPAPVCPTTATRCTSERVEVCDARGQWRPVSDCAEVARSSGGEWTCGTTREDGREINACLRVEGR
jgi:hypothetical protein